MFNKFLIALLIAGSAYAVEVNSGPPTQEAGIYDDVSMSQEIGTKIVLRFSLPTLPSGVTVTAANFYMFGNAGNTGSGTITVEGYVETGADTVWDSGSVSVATLDGITLGTMLDSVGVDTSDGGIEYTLNVLGDAAKGIFKEYADAQTATNVILYQQDYAATPDAKETSAFILGDTDGVSIGLQDFRIGVQYTGGSVVPLAPTPGGVIHAKVSDCPSRRVANLLGVEWPGKTGVVRIARHNAGLHPRAGVRRTGVVIVQPDRGTTQPVPSIHFAASPARR